MQGSDGSCCGVWFMMVGAFFCDFWFGFVFLTSGNNGAIETPTGIFATSKINKSLGKTLKYLV